MNFRIKFSQLAISISMLLFSASLFIFSISQLFAKDTQDVKARDYRIIYSKNIDELEIDIREAIIKGWEPVGGVGVAVHPNDPRNLYFIQAAVVK